MSVPSLRFREFLASWSKFSLNDIAVKIQDGTHFSPEVFESGDYKYLTSKNVKNGYIDLSNLSYISEQAHKEIYKRCDVREGDVLLTKDGTIGQVCVNTLSEPFSLLSSVAFIRTKHTFNNYFLYHLLLSPNGQEEINKSIAGQALKRITLTKINGYIYNFPCFDEQTKIANFLTAVDEKIHLLTQKHDLLTQYKKGVMQQIFSQELRFKDDDGKGFPEWEEKMLGELFNITSSKRVFQNEWTKSGVPFYRAREVVKLSEKGFVENELYISAEMYNEYKVKYGVPQQNDLLVTGVGTIGRLYVVKDGERFYFKDGNIIWFKTLNIVNSQFVSQLFQSPIVKKQIEDNASITTVGTYTIDSAKKTVIPFPRIDEQIKIANFLTSIDDKITATQTQLQAVKQYKQGLLQQMFV